MQNGSAWAALMSASIGSLAFGVATDLSEYSARAAKALLWYRPAGSLSGVAGMAILIWIVVWIVLHARWRNTRVQREGALMAMTIALALAALLTMFPPFYELIGG